MAAPITTVPSTRIVALEHPCIVKDLAKGVKSLGGEPQLVHVLNHAIGDSLIKVNDKTHIYPEPVAGVSLRPDDVLAKKIASSGIDTRNVLVKVTVPKWTGRKRKRGSDEPFTTYPFTDTQRTSVKAPDLLRQLRDNEDKYTTEALGMINETHRFRSQPDYQMHSSDVPLYRELRDHIAQPKYDNLKDFSIDLNPLARGGAVYPLPPTFNATEQPYQYKYEQAYAVKYKFSATGEPICESGYGSVKRVAEPLAPDAETVPTGPPEDLKMSGRQDDLVLRAVEELKKLLETRPLATKRVFGNALSHYREDVLKEANQWAGYYFSAGPWRDVLIKYGVDPRKDPQYRMYQTMTFVLERDVAKASKRGIPSMAARKAEAQNHIFDGKTIPSKIKVWQLCDLTDPIIQELVRTTDLPATCDVYQSGWFHASTLSKARVILKDKTKCLLLGQPAPESEYALFASVDVKPDGAERDDGWDMRRNRAGYSAKVMELIKDYKGSLRVNASNRKQMRSIAAKDTVKKRGEDIPATEEERSKIPRSTK
ncbi:tau 95 subunit of transcription factor TFIIIC [Elasticomyces elasticus]|nr:tau 95 subunit of transcription factor TFIIIC [Elasticomyces elasticus]